MFYVYVLYVFGFHHLTSCHLPESGVQQTIFSASSLHVYPSKRSSDHSAELQVPIGQ